MFKWKQWCSQKDDWKPDGDGILIFKVYTGGLPSATTHSIIDVDDAQLVVRQLVALFHSDIFEMIKGLPLIGEIAKLQNENEVLW
uniref:Uncharacterized protein n=1 Tax=Romanomermis culicivorax TaxID=13658 RepID=A0A915HGC9_ROMCU